MTASKIHQNYTKKSLKLRQKVLDPGKYEVIADCGAVTLFKIKVSCQNKNVAKNLAGLKYIELYAFPVFKDLYERVLNSGPCPVPDYIQNIQKSDKNRLEQWQ
jgi:hypothetical protein